jgi:hypothetical protein
MARTSLALTIVVRNLAMLDQRLWHRLRRSREPVLGRAAENLSANGVTHDAL